MLKRKLLLADDSITIQKVVNLTFADEGIDVITVGDGDSAMAKISEITPDLVLADVHMPGLSGYQVCEMVRANEATRELPVVLLVGSFEPFDENEAARVGANAFLTKPFQSIRQLVSQVSDLMQSAATPNDAPAVAETSVPEMIPVVEPAHDEFTEPIPEKAPDTTDIDSLYARSVGEPPSDGEQSSAYVDAGMDDEMIETVHADLEGDEVSSESQFAFVPSSGGFEQPAAVEYDQEPTAEYQQSEHQQPVETSYQRTDHQEPVETSFQQPVETSYQPMDHQEPVETSYQPTDYQQPVETSYPRPEETNYQHSDYQQPVETSYPLPEETNYQHSDYQQPDETSGYHQPEASELHEPNATTFEETTDFSYEQPSEPTFDEVAPPSPPSPFDSPAEPSSSDPIPSLAQTISSVVNQSSPGEEDVLELPPIDQGKTIEFSTQPNVSAQGGREIVSLSPELMDLLVQKVVKQLSNKE